MNKDALKGMGIGLAIIGALELIKSSKPKTMNNPNKKPAYDITYETWSEDDLEHGDTDDKGFYSKNNNINDDDDLEAVIEEMRQLDDAGWSQHPISPRSLMQGAWYSGRSEDTGDKRTYLSYHFKNLTDEQAKYIIESLKF